MRKQELHIFSESISDKGDRKHNEDCLGSCQIQMGQVFVLCDGLGGHGDGSAASCLVVKEVLDYAAQGRKLEEAVMHAQEALLKEQARRNARESMKTTVTCLLVWSDNRTARFLHVGDSRIYWFENGKYKQRSMDHSVPQMMVNSGAIKEKEIRHHEDRSRLLRVMGTPWDSPKYQVVDNIPVTAKSSFLLCSDGFWELIEEKKMEKLLKKSATPGEWLQAMREVVLANGAGTNMDNYSAIAVYVR